MLLKNALQFTFTGQSLFFHLLKTSYRKIICIFNLYLPSRNYPFFLYLHDFRYLTLRYVSWALTINKGTRVGGDPHRMEIRRDRVVEDRWTRTRWKSLHMPTRSMIYSDYKSVWNSYIILPPLRTSRRLYRTRQFSTHTHEGILVFDRGWQDVV